MKDLKDLFNVFSVDLPTGIDSIEPNVNSDNNISDISSDGTNNNQENNSDWIIRNVYDTFMSIINEF